MTTIKDLIHNTEWHDIDKVMDSRVDYTYTQFRKWLKSIYEDLKLLHTVNPIVKDIELHVKDFPYQSYLCYIKFGEFRKDIKYLTWEILLAIPISAETLRTESPELILTIILKEIFQYGKNKEKSDANIARKCKRAWLVYTDCIPVPIIVLNDKDHSYGYMEIWATIENHIIKITKEDTLIYEEVDEEGRDFNQSEENV